MPRENVKLVRKHWAELAALFPDEFTIDPPGTIADHLREQGTSFEKLPETGSDAAIQWNPEEALIGSAPLPRRLKPPPGN